MDPLFELALSVKAGHRALERLMNDALAPLGITGLQADALSVIGQAGEISLKDLGDLLIAEAGHPSRLVDRMVTSGHVERRPSENDRRSVVLSLTAKGHDLVRDIHRARADVLAAVAPMVAQKDVTAALRLFRTLLPHTDYGTLIERRRALSEPEQHH
jgi:DNA-binding MarR family transcriptional regulator